MIEHHYYKCELCGESFEDEEECRRHEARERMKDVHVHGYDENGNELPWPWSEYDFWQIRAIRFEDAGAWKPVGDYIRWELGYYSPTQCLEPPTEYPFVAFAPLGEDDWENLQERYNFYLDAMKKYLDNQQET